MNTTNAIDREALLKIIRDAAAATTETHLIMKKFLTSHSLKRCDIGRHFATWQEALIAAGVQTKSPTARVDDEALFSDWANVASDLGRIPSMREYKVHGKHGVSTLTNRFGTWSNIPRRFRAYAGLRPEWQPLLKTIFKNPAKPMQRKNGSTKQKALKPKPSPRIADRPACGPRINLEGLSHAPVNEQGVVYLFGHLAPRLGIVVETLQTGYPDCTAKRLVGKELWQNVMIEFEYESRSFRDHRHPVEGCDIIVCWKHNWPDCPGNLEVIALSEHVPDFTSGPVHAPRDCAGAIPA